MNGVLHQKLTELRARHHRAARRRRVMQAGWVWLTALAAAAALDASWSAVGAMTASDPLVIVESPAWLRACMGAALAIGAVIVVMRWRLPRSIRAMPDWRYARLCERRMQLSGNPLVNAVQVGASVDDLSVELVKRARRIGDEQAAQIDAAAVIDTRPMLKAIHRLIAIGVLWTTIIAASFALPGENPLMTALGRIAMPWADRPPYAMVELDASVAPEPVAVGDDATVLLHTSGRPVSAARIRLADGQTIDMQRPNGAYKVQLADVAEPVRYTIEAGGTRTPWRVVEPVHLPRIEGVQAWVELDKQRLPLHWPPPRPVRALAGAELQLQVTSNRSDAQIDLAGAEDLELSVPIEAGEQTVAFGLHTPDGLESRRCVRIELVGLTEAHMQELAETGAGSQQAEQATSVPLIAEDAVAGAATVDADDGTLAQLSSGRPAEGSTPDDESREGTQSPQKGKGSAGGGNGTATDASDPGTAPEPTDAVGTMLERMNVPAKQRVAARAFADAAPPAYRELVARYFLRLAEIESP